MLLLAGFDALSAAGRFSRLSRGVRLTSSASHRGGEHSSFACAATSVTAYFEAIVNRRNSVSRYVISERPSARGEPAIPRRTDAEMENSLGRLRLLLTAGVVLALLPVSVAEAGGMYECEFFGLCDGKERKQ